MTPPSSPTLPPPPVEGTIARSRSRYKGSRQHKTLTNPSEPPSLSAKQLQRLRNTALSPYEPRLQHDRKDERELKLQPLFQGITQGYRGSVNDPQSSDAFVAQSRGSLGKARNRTALQDEVISPSQALQGYPQQYSRGRYDAEVEPHKEAGHDTMPNQKGATSSEQFSRNPETDLLFPHKEEVAATVKSPALPSRGLTQRIAGHSNGKRRRKTREELKRTISAPIAIEPPQNLARPAFDAPVSAVNAGERRVTVKCDQKLMSLTVTPSTTPLDIIRSVADQLADSIDPTSTVLLESFKQLGLERPLRRYEHVRDVLNSWDNDAQNTLVIKPSPTGGRDDLLDVHSIPSSQPVDTSVYVHYSQRPGHWDERWVTLRSDGQMLIAKREGGETANICHISDFDIYIPTARQSAKRIRPPRKICFAVKSQQKSSMFLSTANFVHFFSTSDKTLAASWYKAVLEWRSWYLVNIMGKGEESAQGSRKTPMKADIQKDSNTGFESNCRPPESPSQGTSSIKASRLAKHRIEHIGSYRNTVSNHNLAGDSVGGMPLRSRSEIQTPQTRELTQDAGISAPRKNGPSFVQAIRQEEPKPFATTGLLGRTYTQRQKAQREREKAQNAVLDQPATTPTINPVNSLNRALSQRRKPKPLVDLTPQYQEPPQHSKKGRGVVLEQIPAGGLVEAANTPGAAISIPHSTAWRRPASRDGVGPSVSRSKTVRRDYNSGAPPKPKQTSTSRERKDMAFTGGLLDSNSRGQGGASTGRGVLTGDRQAKEPMLDVGEERQYAPGSLLERVEKQDGGSHPIIEREKKREVVAAVGEGT